MERSFSDMRARYLPISYLQFTAALGCGLALRLYFIAHFPFFAGDTKFYEELAQNWLYHGVYGLFIRGELTPVDLRVPGYPLFLAGIYTVFGRTRMAVMIAQAAIDLATCVIAALIAARISPVKKKSQAATIALWLAVLCPFTASYTAAILTETLAAFFTTLTLFVLVCAFAHTSPVQSLGQSLVPSPDKSLDPSLDRSRETLDHDSAWRLSALFLFVGIFAGLGTLVRPETPLVLAAAGLVMCVRWYRPVNWKKLAFAALWMGVGLLAVLTPWAARNARTMGRVEFLAPHYAESAGDYIPRGFYAWTRTWMVRYRDAYDITWALGKRPIEMNAFPPAAFDSSAERARVASWIATYNDKLKMTPSLDLEFRALAHERTSEHLVRTLAFIPIERAFVIWFTPRVDVLRYSGSLWPPSEARRSNPAEFDVTLFFGFLNFVYAGLAIAGAWRYRANPGCALIVAYLVIRTALFTQLPTVEPRYVVVCFPAMAALGALAFVGSNRSVRAVGFMNSAAANGATGS